MGQNSEGHSPNWWRKHPEARRPVRIKAEPEHKRVLGRSSLEAYAGFVIAVIVAVWPMTATLKVLLMAFVALLVVDAALHSEYSLQRLSRKQRQTWAVVGLLLIAAITVRLLTYQPQVHALFLPDRHLSISQHESLVDLLGQVQFIRKVTIKAPSNGGEAWDYAAELAHAFDLAGKKAGWKVNSIVPLAADDSWEGITILFGPGDKWKSATADQLDAAFARAQVPIHGRGTQADLPEDEMVVIVGYKI